MTRPEDDCRDHSRKIAATFLLDEDTALVGIAILIGPEVKIEGVDYDDSFLRDSWTTGLRWGV